MIIFVFSYLRLEVVTCLFCWYWWNCCQSQLKLSYHIEVPQTSNFNTIAKYKILEENCSWTLAVGNPHKINKELNYIIQSNYVILNLDKLFPWICWFEITVTLKYSSTSLIRPLSSKARFYLHWDSKILLKCPLKRGHPSYMATFSLQKGWHYKRGTTVVMASSVFLIPQLVQDAVLRPCEFD
jgi:hypothetical protein